MLCRKLNLLTDTLVAIDGSKFKAVNNQAFGDGFFGHLRPVDIGHKRSLDEKAGLQRR
jgi:hypothetical protein